MRRSWIAIAALPLALLPAAAHGAGTATLDGSRRSQYTYSGDFGCCLVASGITPAPEPQPSDCAEGLCDQQTLVLSVPAGRQSGRLQLDVRPDLTVQVYAAVYDARGREVARDFEASDGVVHVVVSRLRPGRYRVILYPMAGMGGFRATVSWKINPRHRT